MHYMALILKMEKMEHCGADVKFGLCDGLVLVSNRVEKNNWILFLFILLFLTGIIIPNLAKLNMAWPKLSQYRLVKKT